MSTKIKFYIKRLTGKNCKQISLKANFYDTIKEVKEQISKKEGVSVKLQKLIFNGKQLDNERRLLDYNIKDETSVYLVLEKSKKIQITIKYISGLTTIVNCETFDTILSIKIKIQEIKEIYHYLQSLSFNGRQLNNENTLHDYDITSESIVDLFVDVL